MYYYKKNNLPAYALKNKVENYSDIDSTDLIEITETEWNTLTAPIQPSADDLLKLSYHSEMTTILKWLNDNDYVINKHLLGEYSDTDERWTNYLSNRATKLARYNELEALLND